MNVYSIRLIPSLKIKLCEMLGIASAHAIDQLADRVGSLERKMTHLDLRLKKPGERLIDRSLRVLGVLPEKTYKKSMKYAATSGLKKTNPIKKSNKPSRLGKAEVKVASETRVTAAKPKAAVVTLTQNSPEAVKATPSPRPALILIRQDEETLQSAHAHFGEELEILDVAELNGLEEILSTRPVLSILFDRTLLGQDEDRDLLEGLSEKFPNTAMVGLSSYLTLAFSEAIPQNNDWATFLTKPLTAENLSDLNQKRNRRAIS